jgi:hypothetical protein
MLLGFSLELITAVKFIHDVNPQEGKKDPKNREKNKEFMFWIVVNF